MSVELRPDELQRLLELAQKFAKEGLTFDDVLLLPAKSSSYFGDNLSVNVAVVKSIGNFSSYFRRSAS